MAVLALAFGVALVMLVALLMRNLGMSRRHSWAARTDVAGDSSWMPVIMGSDSGDGNSGGSDCSGADTGTGCDGGGGDGGGSGGD